MKRIIFIAIFFFGCNILHVNSQEIIGTAGNYHENGLSSVCYTIGETIIDGLADQDFQVSQGFHQPQLSVTQGIVPPGISTIDVRAYPNPAQDFVILELTEPGNFNFRVIDVNGKTLLSGKMSSEVTRIPFTRLDKGTYFINITSNNNHKMHLIQIVKQ